VGGFYLKCYVVCCLADLTVIVWLVMVGGYLLFFVCC